MRRWGLGFLVLLAVLGFVAPASAAPTPAREVAGHSLLPLLSSAAERVKVADLVAAAKFPDEAITDPVREQVVLDDAAQRAAGLGLDGGTVVAFFRDQIEASKVVQYGLFSKWTAHPEQAPKEKPDLATEVRPVLDRLTEELLRGLADTVADRASARCAYRLPVVLRVTDLWHGFDALHAQALHRAGFSVCT